MNSRAVLYSQLASSHPHSNHHPYDDKKPNDDDDYDDLMRCIMQLIGYAASLAGNLPQRKYHDSLPYDDADL